MLTRFTESQGLPSSQPCFQTTLWKSGTLRCVLSIQRQSEPVLQVFDGKEALYSEPVKSSDEAVVAAEQLWDMFLTPSQPAH